MRKLTGILLVLATLGACFIGLTACSPDDEYDLTYASWNLSTAAENNIERRMVAAFEKEFNVKVKIEEGIAQGAGYNDSLTGLAAQDSFPDVFMLSTLDYGLSSGYLADISSFTSADADWNKIPAGIEGAVHYGQGIYAVPFAMHMMGYFVNTSLLEEYNVAELSVSPSYADFLNAIEKLSSKVTEGVIGLSHESTLFEWYPALEDPDLGWFSWDGEKYNLDSTAFINGIAKTKEMRDNHYTYDSLSEETRAEYFEGIDGYTALWDQGRLGIRWAETYSIPDMLLKSNGEFNIKFIGVPGGRTPIVGDYLGISATCKNKELAYKFAKWMSFSPAGITQRFALDTSGEQNNTLPLTTDADVIAAYFEKYQTVDGLRDVFSTLSNGIVEGVKVVPGYTRSRWNAMTGIAVGETANSSIGALIDQCWNGPLTYRDYANNLNVLANKQYQNAIADYDENY